MILLDTHVWVWWMQGDTRRLSAKHIALLDSMLPKTVAVSAITCWEISNLAHAGKLKLPDGPDNWLENVATNPQVEIVPLDFRVAAAAALLPDLTHRDPADRFLIAQARALGFPLVTEDAKILAYQHVQAVRCSELPSVLGAGA